MRSILNCTFLVNGLLIPVSILSPVDKSGVKFVKVDSRDNARVRIRHFNSAPGEAIPLDSISRAYELADGRLTPIPDELYDSCLPAPSDQMVFAHFIGVENFPLHLAQAFYYAVPKPESEVENYSYLYHMMIQLNVIGITQVNFHNCSTLFALIPHDNCFLLVKLTYTDRIESAPPLTFFPESKMNETILENLSSFMINNMTDFDLSGYKDQFDETFLSKIGNIAA